MIELISLSSRFNIIDKVAYAKMTVIDNVIMDSLNFETKLKYL